MCTPISRFRRGFTLGEFLVTVAAVAILVVLVLMGLLRAKRKAQEQQCISNLRSVGLGFRQWSNTDKFATQTPSAYGGSMESATNGKVSFTFVVLSNEINAPKILICPADDRTPATNFSSALANSNVSYFVGVNADEIEIRMPLLGDRNLTNGPLPANRLLALPTNSAPGWDQRLHKLRGNVAFADGSVQSLDILGLRMAVTNSGADNLLAFP